MAQDEKKAARLYRLAAKDGYIPALHNLGNCYYYDVGVKINYKKRRNFIPYQLKRITIRFLCSENVTSTEGALRKIRTKR